MMHSMAAFLTFFHDMLSSSFASIERSIPEKSSLTSLQSLKAEASSFKLVGVVSKTPGAALEVPASLAGSSLKENAIIGADKLRTMFLEARLFGFFNLH